MADITGYMETVKTATANAVPVKMIDNGDGTYSQAVGVSPTSVTSTTYDMSAVAITSIATVATPASGKQIRLMSGTFSVSSACSVLFENNAGGTTVFRTPVLLANVPYNFDLGMNGILVTTANHVLKATASTGTVTITGTLRGTEE